MRYEAHCVTCDKPVDQIVIERDALRRSDIVVAWCHGKFAEIDARDSEISEAVGRDGVIKLSVFSKPVPVIEDRDRGDEDPKEPWQGNTCQL